MLGVFVCIRNLTSSSLKFCRHTHRAQSPRAHLRTCNKVMSHFATNFGAPTDSTHIRCMCLAVRGYFCVPIDETSYSRGLCVKYMCVCVLLLLPPPLSTAVPLEASENFIFVSFSDLFAIARVQSQSVDDCVCEVDLVRLKSQHRNVAAIDSGDHRISSFC